MGTVILPPTPGLALCRLELRELVEKMSPGRQPAVSGWSPSQGWIQSHLWRRWFWGEALVVVSPLAGTHRDG